MKKTILLLAVAGLFSLNVNAQNHRCGTMEQYNSDVQSYPQYLINKDVLENFTKNYTQSQSVQRTSGPIYIIPVVFHILHDYGPENVSDDVIRNAVALMNEDYRKLNADTAAIIPPFKALAGDAEIEFRLATKDPWGNCTNGIEHIFTQETYFANDSSKRNPYWKIWPNDMYLNIWVAHNLQNATAAAYAKIPGGPDNTDGIMCWYTYVDNIQNTLTHEAGHHFNLYHPWGPGNSPGVSCAGDDLVGDTPQTMGWDNCNTLYGSVCNPPVVENVQNYMEYSYCDNMFTHGQIARMHATLNSSVSGRNNLWTPANLDSTGTDTLISPTCLPVADFKPSVKSACISDSITFIDQSWQATVTGWSWSFPGGSPSTSTQQSPSVLYSAAGEYTVSLTVSNSTGSDSVTKTSVVRITDQAVKSIPYVESFEDTSSFPGTDGWVYNPDSASTWARVTNSGSAGVASIKANNFVGNAENAIDEWVTPSMDFSNVSFPVMFSFKVANAQRNSTSNDQLKLLYSLNCGKTWTSTSYTKAGAALATAGIITSNFTPSNPSQWRQENVNVNPVQLKPNVRFKFQNTSDKGNNTYIDEINITGNIVGVDEAEDIQTGFTLYPNPSNGITNVDFALTKPGEVSIEVKDMLGRTVAIVMNDNLSSGMHSYKTPALPSGIYLIDLLVNKKHHVRKLVIS
jgi:PKD repeat protein